MIYSQAKYELLTASGEECQQFFVENDYKLELAYYMLFHKEPLQARKLFLSIIDSDIRAHWGAVFASLCEAKVEGYPSYMELRNFFEIDFNILFTYYLGDYIENICAYIDWLVSINPEMFKYIGRVFMKNKYYDFGLNYLKQGINYFYNDPELHYLLAEYYFLNSDAESAQKYANSCLKVLPDYYPAIAILKKLEQNL